MVDRSTVPFALGDVLVTIGGIVEVPGECIFIHPIHNLSVIKYCPKKMAGLSGGSHAAPSIEEADFSDTRLKVNDVTTFYGLTNSFVPVCQRSIVTRVETLKLSDGRPPQFVGANTDSIFFDHTNQSNGIFVGDDGKVAAVRMCFVYQSVSGLSYFSV